MVLIIAIRVKTKAFPVLGGFSAFPEALLKSPSPKSTYTIRHIYKTKFLPV